MNEQAYSVLAQLYDELMSDVDYDEWAELYARFMDMCGMEQPPGSYDVLDVACGTGSMSLALYRRGYRVTAMDISGQMLDIAQRRIGEAGARIPLVRQNLRSLRVHRPVDAIIAACDGVNYLLDKQSLLDFFGAAHAALKPGGALLFDISSKEKIEETLAGRQFCFENERAAYMWTNMYNYRKRLLTMDLVFFFREADGRYSREREWQVQRAHTQEELLDYLKQTGFNKTHVDDTPMHADKAGHRLHFVCVRE